MIDPISHRRRRLLLALQALPLTLLVGCAKKAPLKPESKPESVPAKPPPKLRIEIKAAGNANRGPGGGGLPVVVRVYELKSPGGFATADFFGLYDRESDILGADLLARHEVTLTPAQTLPIERPLDTQAGYLGVIVAFREIDQSQWRASLRLNPDQDNQIRVEVGAQSVSIRHA